ncbi:uncharacterized protein F4807DRAFT_73398 [Annulohypoxylon truncatum]|uniref:uncharacterized protein n=1 Tax=Annulohypoxylon truncatum TaxID=327061 RepID=UPI0020082A54|nr:uncharacterized protein F4807DRAFT_73398 [Annulohypoxylon truncatum]KAI1210218.1 hypothetical protein F4807DRAFT_73398 [Annulohypoxylon truncatum]
MSLSYDMADSNILMLPHSKAASRGEPPKNMFPLLELPAEMVLAVSDHLPDGDKICLALTCKDLFFLLGVKSKKQLKPSTMEELSCRLEKDIPWVCYCHFCKALVRFYKDGTGSNHINPTTHLHSVERDLFLYHSILHSIHFPGSTFTLPYFRARLVTNYQILGPQHGIPPAHLSYQQPDALFSSTRHPDDASLHYQFSFKNDLLTFFSLADLQIAPQICHKESWAAKMVGDELFLSATRSWVHSGADNGALQSYLLHSYLKVCMHTMIWEVFSDVINVHSTGSRSVDISGLHITGWCKNCLTDWDTSVEWISPAHGLMITFTTYHNLGSCRSPFHWKWRAMCEGWRYTENRDKPSGAVKSGWLDTKGT